MRYTSTSFYNTRCKVSRQRCTRLYIITLAASTAESVTRRSGVRPSVCPVVNAAHVPQTCCGIAQPAVARVHDAFSTTAERLVVEI